MLAKKESDNLEKDRAFSSHGQGDSLYNHATQQVKVSVLGVAVLLTLGFGWQLWAQFFGRSLLISLLSLRPVIFGN